MNYIFLFILFVSFSTQAQTSKVRDNTFNPSIGINALTLYQSSNRGNSSYVKNRNGLGLQEIELLFSGDIDPYWRFDSNLSLHQEVTVDETTTPHTRTAENKFEAEEIFAESLNLPYVTFKVGKFYAAFGRHNGLHTHAFPFIDAPLIHQTFLGDHGFNDTGASVSTLLPLPWFSELTVQGLSGQGSELEYFKSPSADTVVGVGRFKNLWDLNQDLTFELGLSNAQGENSTRNSTKFYGADTAFKWRTNKSQAVIWTTEWIQRIKNESTQERGQGLVSALQYQFSQRWWVQARTESLDIVNQATTSSVPSVQKKHSALIGYMPSEFSGLRLQFDELDDRSAEKEKRILFQFNFSLGAHPAHTY